MASNPRDHGVGYRKPPERTRFEKGRSGNPKGRPRGAKNLTTLLGETLSEVVAINENGRRRKITKLAATCKRLVNEALTGNLSAMRLLLELVRLNDNRTQPPSTEDAALTDQFDQEVMGQLRERMLRAVQEQSEGDEKKDNSNDRTDPI
jgi:hypothetical protein